MYSLPAAQQSACFKGDTVAQQLRDYAPKFREADHNN